MLILSIAIIIAVCGGALYLLRNWKKEKKEGNGPGSDASIQMQMQAYERLILLTDRIALPNLISRVSRPGVSCKEMQHMLTQGIKEEFNHNITQQIYVSADAWTAMKNLKEQNLLIINQFANVLPPHATGLDLNKMLLEYLMNDKKGSLHEIVAEVLSYEAKRVIGMNA